MHILKNIKIVRIIFQKQFNKGSNIMSKKIKNIILAVDNLSLGISMVVATVLGVLIGLGLKSVFGYEWLLWLGILWGVLASFLNVYKVYKRHKKDLDKLSEEIDLKIDNQ